MNRTVLVTGGAGYIGSIVSEIMLNKGYNVIVLDDFSTGNVLAVDGDAMLFESDFSEPNVLDEIFMSYKVDFVIHLAASAHVSDSVKNPMLYYENNLCKTIGLLNKMWLHGVKKIIFTSTAAVYGEPDDDIMSEDDPKYPCTPYGKSKLMVEQVLGDFSRAYGIDYVTFRYLCVAGATERHGEARRNETHLIPLLMKQALGSDKPFYVFGNKFPTKDGSGVRDYFHVLDIAEAHILAMNKWDDVKNNVFNLGNGVGWSVFDVIQAVESILDVKIKYEIADARKGDPSAIIADISRARKMLGWEPTHSLSDIIKSAYYWAQNRYY